MKDDKSSQNNSGKENEPVLENGKKKGKEEKPPTKVVVRRLPPSMTEEQFKMQVSPLPDFDYFYFVSADMTLTPNAFSRAYINFLDQNDLFIFTQKFDGYVFVDSKGGEYPAVVEFAPFQRIPKNRPNRRKDPKIGTIEADAFYIAFKERLEAENLEKKASANVSKQHFFETSLISEKKEANNTPLLDFIKNRKAERQRIRDEKREEKRKKDLERRRAKEDQKRIKKEDETSVVKVLNSQNPPKESVKEKETKPSLIKKKADDAKLLAKEKHSTESRSKETKSRTGKSYQEERQRQAERREEQRKKLSKSQSNSSTAESKPLTHPEDKEASKEQKEAEGETNNTQDEKFKDTEQKKFDKKIKKEVAKRPYKYESKRDKEPEDSRRTKRSNKREDERNDDTSKKRYSESRKSYDSQRDKYKDRDKNKIYDKKKTLGNSTETSRGKTNGSSNVEGDTTEEVEKVQSGKGNEETLGNNKSTKQKEILENVPKSSSTLESITSDVSKDEINPIRRKSFDHDSHLLTNNEFSRSKGELLENKRRNSVGSSKTVTESDHYKGFLKSLVSKVKDEERLQNENVNTFFSHEEVKSEDKLSSPSFEDKDMVKRRNSTGDRQSLDKSSPRRNSLGSADKNKTCTFIDNEVSSNKICEESKSKEKQEKRDRNSDPRTERRIRNKDRPSIEIYRPGMGKFSKQRMKNPSSSTEVDSPSSSPSPTPVMKHKSSASSN